MDKNKELEAIMSTVWDIATKSRQEDKPLEVELMIEELEARVASAIGVTSPSACTS